MSIQRRPRKSNSLFTKFVKELNSEKNFLKSHDVRMGRDKDGREFLEMSDKKKMKSHGKDNLAISKQLFQLLKNEKLTEIGVENLKKWKKVLIDKKEGEKSQNISKFFDKIIQKNSTLEAIIKNHFKKSSKNLFLDELTKLSEMFYNIYLSKNDLKNIFKIRKNIRKNAANLIGYKETLKGVNNEIEKKFLNIKLNENDINFIDAIQNFSKDDLVKKNMEIFFLVQSKLLGSSTMKKLKPIVEKGKWTQFEDVWNKIKKSENEKRLGLMPSKKQQLSDELSRRLADILDFEKNRRKIEKG